MVTVSSESRPGRAIEGITGPAAPDRLHRVAAAYVAASSVVVPSAATLPAPAIWAPAVSMPAVSAPRISAPALPALKKVHRYLSLRPQSRRIRSHRPFTMSGAGFSRGRPDRDDIDCVRNLSCMKADACGTYQPLWVPFGAQPGITRLIVYLLWNIVRNYCEHALFR